MARAAPRSGKRSGGRRGVGFEEMAARRAERLVNLVIALLSTRQYLTAEQLREAIPGYEPADGTERADEAFKRMFERDKAELRDLGIPLETGRTSIADIEDGYRISRRDYELPPVDFDPAESAAVGLAARLWQSATLGAPARSALLKLRAGGTVLDPDVTITPPQVDASDPALGPLLEAVRERRVVTFAHRSGGDGEPAVRHVEPWGVLSWSRRWYLVGHDLDRDAPRSFRLSRFVGDVTVTRASSTHERPDDLDMVAMVIGRSDRSREATLLVRPGRAGRLRQAALQEQRATDRASAEKSPSPADKASGPADKASSPADNVAELAGADTTAGADRPGRATGADPQGWDTLVVDFADLGWLAREIAAAGTDVRVLEPPDLIDAVCTVLRAAVEPPDPAALDPAGLDPAAPASAAPESAARPTSGPGVRRAVDRTGRVSS